MEIFTVIIFVIFGFLGLYLVKKRLGIDNGSVQTISILLPAIAWLVGSGALKELTVGDIGVKFNQAGLERIQEVTTLGKLTDLKLAKYDDPSILEGLAGETEFTGLKGTPGGEIDLWVYLDEKNYRQDIAEWLNSTFTQTWLLTAKFKTGIKGEVELHLPSMLARDVNISFRYVVFGYRNERIEFYAKYDELFESGRVSFSDLADKQIFFLSNAIGSGQFDKVKGMDIFITPIKESETNLLALSRMNEIEKDELLVVDKRGRYIGAVHRHQIVTHLLTALAGT